MSANILNIRAGETKNIRNSIQHPQLASTAAKEFGVSSFAESMDEKFQIPQALQVHKIRQGPQRHGLLNLVWVNLFGVHRIRTSNLSQTPEPETKSQHQCVDKSTSQKKSWSREIYMS